MASAWVWCPRRAGPAPREFDAVRGRLVVQHEEHLLALHLPVAARFPTGLSRRSVGKKWSSRGAPPPASRKTWAPPSRVQPPLAVPREGPGICSSRDPRRQLPRTNASPRRRRVRTKPRLQHIRSITPSVRPKPRPKPSLINCDSCAVHHFAKQRALVPPSPGTLVGEGGDISTSSAWDLNSSPFASRSVSLAVNCS